MPGLEEMVILLVFCIVVCFSLYGILWVLHKINDKVREKLPELRDGKDGKADDNW